MSSVQEISDVEAGANSGLFTSDLNTSPETQTKTSIPIPSPQNNTKLSTIEGNKPYNESTSQASVSNDDQIDEILSTKLMAAMDSNKGNETAQTCTGSERKPTPRGKNAKKKQNKQHINIPPVNVAADPNQTQFPPMAYTAMNGASAQDHFHNYVNPLYANANSRYLENLTHHPQYQFMPQVQNHRYVQQSMHAANMQQSPPTMQTGAMHQSMYTSMQQTVPMRQLIGRQHSMQINMHHAIQHRPHPASAPSTPVGMHQRPLTGSIPNSPNMGFYHNMMQHPLLNHPYVKNNFNANMQQANVNAHTQRQESVQNKLNVTASKVNDSQESSKNKNKNNKKNESYEVKTFEPYMSTLEVEAGLKDNTLIAGVLRINPKQFQQAFISTMDRDEQDIYIDGIRNRNRALEGDIVVVQIVEDTYEDQKEAEKNPQADKSDDTLQNECKKETIDDNDLDEEKNDQLVLKKGQKRGKVVCIKEKVHTRTCIGNLKLLPDKNRQKALFVPRDYRIPRLNIPFTSWPDNFYQDVKRYENTLFSAKIISWTYTRFAIGKIISNIGQAGNMKTETIAILSENDLDITPYGPEVRDLFPRLDYVIPAEEINKREDCRNLCVFSIDPSNCRDIDDAVSCKELSNGNYEIGVHISDVAHYLTEGTILDEKVAKKATTIYLVERAYHMLPDELCMLCSLFPGVDKLAFSVFWEMTKNGKVLSHRFAKTVINSCSQLAYEHAQAVLEKRQDAEASFPETYNNFKYDHIRKSIEVIGGISANFRKKRFENGALRIDQPKVAFRLSPVNGLPESYNIYNIKESHQMIEEFMLLANQTVAQRIYDDHPDIAFLRCHPPPSGFMLRQLVKALAPMGIILDISSAGALHQSLLPYTDVTSPDRGRAMVMNMLCAKPMTRAKYFCSAGTDDDDFVHYALNIPIYTHFTSPIRRYADIMVHRLLAASINFRENPKWEVDKVRMIAAQCNKQKYNAKKAGEMSSDLYMLKYIEMNSPIITEAVVVEIRERSIDLIIVAMSLNRRLFFNPDFPGEFTCIKHECGSIKMSKMDVTWRAEDNKPETKQLIEVFSTLQVHLSKSKDMDKVETTLVRPQ